MSASCSLYPAGTPAFAGGEAPTSASDQSAAPPAATQSFFSMMSQAGCDGFPNPFSEARNPDGTASTSVSADSPDNAADLKSSASCTLLAVMVQSEFAGGPLHKTAAGRAASIKNAPAAPGAGPQSFKKTPGAATAAQDKGRPDLTVQSQMAAGASRQPMPPQAVNSKTAPDGQEDEDQSAADTSGTDASAPGTPKAVPGSAGNAAGVDVSLSSILTVLAAQSPVAVANLLKPASVQPVNPKIAPVSGEGGSQSFTKTPGGDASAAETPNPHSDPSGKPASTEARSSPDGKPGRAGHDQKTIDPSAVETAASTQEPGARPAEPAGPSLQPVGAQITMTPQTGPLPADGTRGALDSQRMNSAGEKNEIAGANAQKVPGASSKDGFAIQAAGDSAGASNSDQSGHKQDAIVPVPVMDWPAKAGELNLDAGKAAGTAPSANHTTAVAERVGNLVNQQVVMIRQSGAHNISVSLKLDPHTELNLQLTNHNGQIEASIRCERGSMAGLDSHWKDLQDSLARQNVQLLPLENKTASRTPAFDAGSNPESASSFKQSPQNPQRNSRQARQDMPLDAAVSIVPTTRNTTTRTSSRQGWESWA
jgi:hypothetical protein